MSDYLPGSRARVVGMLAEVREDIKIERRVPLRLVDMRRRLEKFLRIVESAPKTRSIDPTMLRQILDELTS